MSLLGSYIGRALLRGVGLTLLVLITIAWFSTYANELEDVGRGDYSAAVAAVVVTLKVPELVEKMLPIALLLGGLLAFGGLAASNELTVMRSSGVSIFALLWRQRWGLLALLLVAMANQGWVAPWMGQYAERVKEDALGQPQSRITGDVCWIRDGEYYLRLDEVGHGGQLYGVRWMRLPRPGRVVEVGAAVEGGYRNGEWILKQARVTLLQGEQIEAAIYPQLRLPLTLTPDHPHCAPREPRQLQSHELLLRCPPDVGGSGEQAPYCYALWHRVAYPFSLAVMLLLALPFSVAEGRSLTTGRRLVVGVALGVGFYLFNRVWEGLGEMYHYPPALTAFTVPALFLLLALVMIRQRGL